MEALFYAALELGPEDRIVFLDKNCGDDNELRKEVQDLLDATEKPMAYLEHSVLDAVRDSMSEPRNVLSPGANVTHYQVVSMLGSGGMGEVYLAQDTRLRRRVALKTLTTELTRDRYGLHRFEHEAQAASALNHPNILTIYEFGEENGLHFIASEYVEGVTLRQQLLNERLELDSTLDVATQIASALAAAHSAGIVHRDVKPENVMVRPDGLVKVLDFGIAKLGEVATMGAAYRNSPTLSTSITQPGIVLGTAKYMSPEQARGMAVDGRSDVFSLGTVIYEMITGKVAFEGETRSDVIAEILKGEPVPLHELAPNAPPEIERIVIKAMRKNREERYQTAKDLLVDLHEIKKDFQFQAALRKPRADSDRIRAVIATESATAPQAFASYFRRHTVLAATAVLAVLLAVIGVRYVMVRNSHPVQVAAPLRTLAILPFRNLKQDPQTDFLGFSLADAVITKLGYIRALTVRPSSSVDKYRNQTIDPQKVATDLNVDTLLTGTFIKDGDDLKSLPNLSM